MFRFLRGTTCGEKKRVLGELVNILPLMLFVVFPTSSKQAAYKQNFLRSFIFHFKHLLKMFKFHLNLKLSYFLLLLFPAQGKQREALSFKWEVF